MADQEEREQSEQPVTRRVKASSDVEISTYLEIAETNAAAKEPQGPRSEKLRPYQESIVVLDFGSQYSQLIARRVREAKVYSELVPHDASWQKVKELNPKGIILSGGPASVYEPGAPQLPPWVLESGLPVLAICYGMHLLGHQLGGKVERASRREYGQATLYLEDTSSPVFAQLPFSFVVWMSHGDVIAETPPGFKPIAYSDNTPVAAMANDRIIGLQFHPEVVHTPLGRQIIENFVYGVCHCAGTWTAGSFVERSASEIKEKVGDGKVICALSGGVDSSVVASLLHRAVGDQLTCIFVNNGLLRMGEAEAVLETFKRNMSMNLIYVDATDIFLRRLSGVVDPEMKRRIIGEEFIRLFEREAAKIGKIDFLAQGTLYPDVIESTTPDTQAAARIKTHHNVGGLPKDMAFSLIEPLRYLFKDEVREVGVELGLPHDIVWRQPFPGPGLAIRVIGEITRERLDILKEADAIVRQEIKGSGVSKDVWQYFAILTPLKSVGVMGDGRTYAHVVAVRAVTSQDGMTADWARLPYDLLGRISNRIVNEVPGVNRVVYDISSKPPSTIEWE